MTVLGKLVLIVPLIAILMFNFTHVPSDHLAATDIRYRFTVAINSIGTPVLLWLSNLFGRDLFIPVARGMYKRTQQISIPGVKVTDIESRNGWRVKHYLPASMAKSDKPRKTIFYIHGGGWMVGGSKVYGTYFSKSFEYQVFGIEYRLSPETAFPGPLDDCVEGLRMVLRMPERYNIGEYSIVGISAGGHLTLGVMQTIDFMAEFNTKPVQTALIVPVTQPLRFDLDSQISYDKGGLSVGATIAAWVAFAGIKPYYDKETRELISKNKHWSKTVSEDTDLQSRLQSPHSSKPSTDDTAVSLKTADLFENLIYNPKFAPGLANDDILKTICSRSKTVLVAVAEFDILHDEGRALASRMKALCDNVTTHTLKNIGHMDVSSSDEILRGSGFKQFDPEIQKLMDLLKFGDP